MGQDLHNGGTLKRSLKNRHLQMIALGSSIGTGLFYGSAATIELAGPAIILSYLLGGIFIFIFMRMLGEMTVHEPVGGGYVYYADKYLGGFAAYLLGWNYWIIYLLLSMAEVAACTVYLAFWFPDIPTWATSLFCIILIAGINSMHVRFYGETEFVSSLIKVSAIILIIVFGLYIAFAEMGPFKLLSVLCCFTSVLW
ncbi:amino acid permease [Veillonella sp.]|jgi:L-asparagine transporter-like permease|uniref:amino acid permease n=1 Tax=Veillonella sp. TaxID=1926307 RepID=UPI0025D8F2CA|nr:amino acid permease [Veillonella sp.]